MDDNRLECPECGKHFSSEELLEEHTEIEHAGSLEILPPTTREGIEVSDFRKYLNRSFFMGLLAGIIIAGTVLGGYMYWDSLDHRTRIPVTVITCDNCSYDDFRTATDRMFNTRYREVDYSSEEGQEIIRKYNIRYVPAFVFDSKVKKAEEFYKVESVLVEFEDAYVVPDRGVRVAQRLSEGRELPE